MSWFPNMSSMSSLDDNYSSLGEISLKPEIFEKRGTTSEKIGQFVFSVFSSLYELISSGCRLLNDYVFTPIAEHAIRPILNSMSNLFNSLFACLSEVADPFYETVSGAFESIGTVFARIRDPLRDWVINPITEHALRPVYDAINELFTSMRPMLARLTIDLMDRISPIIEPALETIYDVITELFNTMKTAFADLLNALNSHIFTPVYEGMPPVFRAIKPYGETSLEFLNDWIFKPFGGGLSDCWNGIRTAASVDEYSMEELLENIDTTEKAYISQGKDLKTYIPEVLEISSSNEESFKRVNSLMAIYLAKDHSLVIDRTWIREDMISPELQGQYNEKANVKNLPEEL